jgi:hypothetical protein
MNYNIWYLKKETLRVRCSWLTPVILAPWEAEIGRIEVWAQPGQIAGDTQSTKLTRAKWTRGVAQLVDRLPCKHTHTLKKTKQNSERPGAVAHICNRSYSGGKDQEDSRLKASLGRKLMRPILWSEASSRQRLYLKTNKRKMEKDTRLGEWEYALLLYCLLSEWVFFFWGAMTVLSFLLFCMFKIFINAKDLNNDHLGISHLLPHLHSFDFWLKFLIHVAKLIKET